MGAYVLTAENLITGALADDNVATGGHHIDIHRPSGSTGGSGIAANPATWEERMAVITRGFGGRRRDDTDLPPGQYRTDDFPVLSAGPTPRIGLDEWELAVVTETGERSTWSWAEFTALPADEPTVDIHCVTHWSKFGTSWRGVSVDTLLADVETAAEYVVAHSYGGYSSNFPLEDLLDGQAWVAYEFEGEPLVPVHGGPARLLVPHLYFWKSAKWLRALELRLDDAPGFWETAGYHNHADPWHEQRYWGD